MLEEEKEFWLLYDSEVAELNPGLGYMEQGETPSEHFVVVPVIHLDGALLQPDLGEVREL